MSETYKRYSWRNVALDPAASRLPIKNSAFAKFLSDFLFFARLVPTEARSKTFSIVFFHDVLVFRGGTKKNDQKAERKDDLSSSLRRGAIKRFLALLMSLEVANSSIGTWTVRAMTEFRFFGSPHFFDNQMRRQTSADRNIDGLIQHNTKIKREALYIF